MDVVLDNLPKVELHVHLEGAIPVNAFWELIKKYKHTKSVISIENLAERFKYKDFSHFIETWIWSGQFLKEYDDYRFIAQEISADLKKQHVEYAELFYSPSRDSARHLDARKITAAIMAGFNLNREGIKLNLIADIVRDNGPAEAMKMVNELAEVKELGVVGIGIGGSEEKYPPGPFKDVFEKARGFGFKTTAHAGEESGGPSIWAVINELKVDRIGQAVKAKEDKSLIKYLKDKRIPLEMCPISNLRTRVIEKIEDHPIREFYDEGLIVTVNTDDPKMFDTSLVEEYRTLMTVFGFQLSDIKKLIQYAIDAAWCTEEEKKELRNRLDRYNP
ncbi:MAG: adenosine deaminase [Acidobacteria bacterium]|jgi:adenosine deaminase|nr:adenosine deaminase [Acidobacteriota bacterium]